jgi:hypothetical protein
MAPDSLLDDANRSQYLDIERAPNASKLIALLAAVGETATATAG